MKHREKHATKETDIQKKYRAYSLETTIEQKMYAQRRKHRKGGNLKMTKSHILQLENVSSIIGYIWGSLFIHRFADKLGLKLARFQVGSILWDFFYFLFFLCCGS